MNQVTVVGIGPGGRDQMTIKAWQTLEQSEVIVGYTVYVELIKELLPEKEYRTTPMRREEDRWPLRRRGREGGLPWSAAETGACTECPD